MIIKKWCNINNNIIEFKDCFDSYSHNGIVTCNEEMIKQLRLIEKVSISDANIIILGDTGTGKELYAEYIHNISNRNKHKYLKLNCATLSESLFESEMFGYTAGSFTGALRCGKLGIFEIAKNGTLFLDEISDMPLNIQSKFLRVLEDNTITKIGDSKEIKINVRIIVASNTDLKKMVTKNLFREDLFYRLNVININLLPLKKRKEDIVLLSLYFLQKYNKMYLSNKHLTENAMTKFLSYDWPGNVRELKHTMERLVLLSDTELIDDFDIHNFNGFSNTISDNTKQKYTTTEDYHTLIDDFNYSGKTYKSIVSEFENNLINHYIKKCGSLRKAAKELQISPSAISRKLKLFK